MDTLESPIYREICCIKGCDKVPVAMGMCNMHWRRNKKYGSPVALLMPAAANRGRAAIDKFMERIKKVESGCWIWTGGKDSDGYGLFNGKVGGVLYRRAHRFSVVYHKHVMPQKGDNVCHTCDTPACVNPDHLFIGTVKENQQDKWNKDRGYVHRGESHWSTKLTADDVRAIRASTEKQRDIAQKYGLTQTTVSDIKRRKSWAHID